MTDHLNHIAYSMVGHIITCGKDIERAVQAAHPGDIFG